MNKLTVLGLGNILMRDEGIGVLLMEKVRDSLDWPDVEFIDGGVGGLGLMSVIEQAQRLIVFDAAEMGLPPGSVRVIAPEQLRDDDAGRMSMHDVSFAEVLRLCGQFFTAPQTVRILAIQPAVVDYGRKLSDELSAALPELIAAGTNLIKETLRS